MRLIRKAGLATVVHTYYEKLHSLTVKKITIWYKFWLLLDRAFSELSRTSFNPQFI